MKKYFNYLYFLLILLFSSIYLFFLVRSFIVDGVLSFSLGELMINYSCGFIRRGLLGSVFLIVSRIINIHIFDIYNYATFIAQLVLFFFITLRLYKIKLLNILFLSSPAGILFIINNWEAYGYKDIYTLIYSILILLIIKNDFTYKNAFVFIAILIGGLLHEPFLFFSAPYILLSININNSSNDFEIIKKHNITFFSGLLIVIGLLFFANSFNTLRIPCLYKNAISELEKYPEKQKINLVDYKDPIRWVGENLSFGIERTSRNYKEPFLLKWISIHLFIIIASMFLVCICIFKLSDISHFIFKYKLWFIYLFFSYLFIYFIALDWGRWLYLILMNFIIFVSVNKEKIKFEYNPRNSINLFVIFILISCSLVYIPHFYYGIFPNNPFNTIFYRIFVGFTESI